jgi:hypothetical protein
MGIHEARQQIASIRWGTADLTDAADSTAFDADFGRVNAALMEVNQLGVYRHCRVSSFLFFKCKSFLAVQVVCPTFTFSIANFANYSSIKFNI